MLGMACVAASRIAERQVRARSIRPSEAYRPGRAGFRCSGAWRASWRRSASSSASPRSSGVGRRQRSRRARALGPRRRDIEAPGHRTSDRIRAQRAGTRRQPRQTRSRARASLGRGREHSDSGPASLLCSQRIDGRCERRAARLVLKQERVDYARSGSKQKRDDLGSDTALERPRHSRPRDRRLPQASAERQPRQRHRFRCEAATLGPAHDGRRRPALVVARATHAPVDTCFRSGVCPTPRCRVR